MRFCFLTTFFPPQHFGGDAIFVVNLANALAAEGHGVDVVHCADSFEVLRGHVQPSPVPLDARIQVHTLHSPLGSLSPILTYATGQPWLKSGRLQEILAENFDVVHWHNLSLVGGPGALKYGKGVRLCTLHDYWFICPTHILFKFNREACTRRDCISCTLVHKRPPQPWRAGRLIENNLQYIDRFLAPSQFVREKYKESHLRIDATVLPHFVPKHEQQPKDAVPDPYFLYVGRLEKAKGVQTILPLFRKPGRRLLIAGSGMHEEELRKQAADLSQVTFLGRVPHDKLAKLYADATATLVPSLCYETFGLTILESLQQATPVIASRYGGLPELVADTGGGFVYSDLEQLEGILERLDRDPDCGRMLGIHGYQSTANYSAQAHLKRYLQIVEEIRSHR